MATAKSGKAHAIISREFFLPLNLQLLEALLLGQNFCQIANSGPTDVVIYILLSDVVYVCVGDFGQDVIIIL